jgi:hypothetical protein
MPEITLTQDDGSTVEFIPKPALEPAPDPAPVVQVPRFLGIQPPTINDASGGSVSEFINLVWACRGFRPPEKPYAYTGGPALDAEGNPTGDFGMRLITEGKEGRKGVYTFKAIATAQPTIKANSGNTVRDVQFNPATGELTAKIDVQKFVTLEVIVTNTQGGLKDVQVLAPGYTSADPIFTNEFRAALEPFGAVRWMGAQRTNEEAKQATVPVISWGQHDIAKPHWGYGMPPQACLAYGTQANKPVWICVPALADDDYVVRLGNLIRDRQGPEAPPVYVEYSNEVWNGVYKAHKQNKEITEATKGTGAGAQLFSSEGNLEYAAWRRVVRRSVEIKHLLGRNPSVRMVLGIQVNRGPAGHMLGIMLDYCERYHGPPADYFYGICTAPYLYPDRAQMQRPDLTIDDVCSEMMVNVGDAETAGQVATNDICKRYGLVSLAYELGTDLYQYDIAVGVKAAAQYDPRAGDAVEGYLGRWFAAGGQQAYWLQSHGGYSKNGYWGLTEDLAQLATPKYQAAVRVAERVK